MKVLGVTILIWESAMLVLWCFQGEWGILFIKSPIRPNSLICVHFLVTLKHLIFWTLICAMALHVFWRERILLFPPKMPFLYINNSTNQSPEAWQYFQKLEKRCFSKYGLENQAFTLDHCCFIAFNLPLL